VRLQTSVRESGWWVVGGKKWKDVEEVKYHCIQLYAALPHRALQGLPREMRKSCARLRCCTPEKSSKVVVQAPRRTPAGARSCTSCPLWRVGTPWPIIYIVQVHICCIFTEPRAMQQRTHMPPASAKEAVNWRAPSASPSGCRRCQCSRLPQRTLPTPR